MSGRSRGKEKKSDFSAVDGKACKRPEKIKFLIFSFQMVFSVCFLKVENDLTCLKPLVKNSYEGNVTLGI